MLPSIRAGAFLKFLAAAGQETRAPGAIFAPHGLLAFRANSSVSWRTQFDGAGGEMKRNYILMAATAFVGLGAVVGLAQFRNAREMAVEKYVEPNVVPWTNPPAFKKDVFTFVRIQYSVDGTHGFGHSPPDERWRIDAPDSDLNFSYRLQQMTSLKVDPDGKFLKITDKELFDYPFIYIVEPGRLTFTTEEVPILRRYLLNGGFLMCDDFWGDREWDNFYKEIKRVFPEYEPQELPLEHPIFSAVFPLSEKPQVPGFPWLKYFLSRGTTYEFRETGSETVHYRAIFDDRNRMMVILCHNTDLGDGWEREGEREEYFQAFSEKKAYPMGINIVVYAMTH